MNYIVAEAKNMDNKGDSTILTYDREPGIEMSASVPTKYRGTAADARDMKILGKTQVLRVLRRAWREHHGRLLKADGGTAQFPIHHDAWFCEHCYGIVGSAFGLVQTRSG